MHGLVHHVALGLSVLALAHAALRIVSTIAPAGLERVVAAAVAGVALAVAAALALGLVGLGGSAAALALAAAAIFALTVRLLPSPAVRPLAELGSWWANLERPARIGAALVCGASVGWTVWQLLNFSIGFDSSLYHYPLVAGWIENGRPGSGLTLSYDIPYANYPLTDEVALTFLAGIARSWVPLVLWNLLLLALMAVASWVTLRNLSVSRLVAGLGCAVLLTPPIVVRQLNEPQTDLPGLVWVACIAALATGARRRPALLVPAIVAAGVAIGTKPSTAPMAIATVAVGAYLARARLRALAGWLALGLAAAVVVGGIWYLRNLVQHGSPLWPFAAGPWGDPTPRFFSLVDATFLERPRATLEGRLDIYEERLGGTWLVLGGAIAVLAFGIASRGLSRRVRRPLVVAGALTLGALLIWSTAWGTGLPTTTGLAYADSFPTSSLRYMLPAIGAAIVAVALATRARGGVATAATLVLALALAWNLWASARLGTPWTPPLWVLALGALGGLAALLLAEAVAGRLRPDGRRRPALPAWAPAAVAAAVIGALLAPFGPGVVERYTRVERSTAYGPELVRWFLDQPGFDEGDGPIGIASRGVIAQLAGDHFRHELVLVPQHASCREVEALARRMPVVVTAPLFTQGLIGVESYSAARCLAGRRPLLDADPFFVYRLGDVQATEPVGVAAAASEPISRTSGSGTMNLPPPSR